MGKKCPTVTVTFRNLYTEVASKSGFTKAEVRAVLELTRDVLYEHLRNLDCVQLFRGLAILGKYKPPRKFSANWKSQEGREVVSKAKNVVEIYAGEYLREYINSSGENFDFDEEDEEDEF